MNPIGQPSPQTVGYPLQMPALLPWVLLGLITATVGVWLYFTFKPQPAPTGTHMPAAPAPQVSRETTVPVSIAKPLKAFRPEVKRKLKLPESVQANPAQHVIASSRTVGDERPHTLTTVIDANTGEATTFDRAEPLPWLGVSTKTEIGAFYGVKNGVPAFRVQAQQELLRVKALHLGAVASADVVRGDVDTYVGVGVWARW